eukprot:scaffold69498_cov42-Phaeocystis_antarctica.AAC.2
MPDGRGWPKLRAAWRTIWRWKRPPESQLAEPPVQAPCVRLWHTGVSRRRRAAFNMRHLHARMSDTGPTKE